MKVLTDDPDWAPKIYEARALAMRLIEKHAPRRQLWMPASGLQRPDNQILPAPFAEAAHR